MTAAVRPVTVPPPDYREGADDYPCMDESGGGGTSPRARGTIATAVNRGEPEGGSLTRHSRGVPGVGPASSEITLAWVRQEMGDQR